jgi:hypothetical protein
VQKGVPQQYSRALRFIPEKKRFGEEARSKAADQRPQLPWRSSRGRGTGGSGSWGSSGRRGSDSDSWRKGDNSDEVKDLASAEEQEVSSPLKKPNLRSLAGVSKKVLEFNTPGLGLMEKEKEQLSQLTGVGVEVGGCEKLDEQRGDNTQDVVGDIAPSPKKNKKIGGSGKGFRRLNRAKGAGGKGAEEVNLEKKRLREDEESMDVEGQDRATKISRQSEVVGVSVSMMAGPADRSCEDQ